MESEWRDDLPDWKDNWRRVEIEGQDGVTGQGVLDIVDQTPGPDEIPIFEVIPDGGASLSIYSAKRWRFL